MKNLKKPSCFSGHFWFSRLSNFQWLSVGVVDFFHGSKEPSYIHGSLSGSTPAGHTLLWFNGWVELTWSDWELTWSDCQLQDNFMFIIVKYTYAPPLKHDQFSNRFTSWYEPLPTATGMFCSVQSQDVGCEDYFSLHRRVDRYWISRGVTRLGSWRGVGWWTTCASQHENTSLGRVQNWFLWSFFLGTCFFLKPHSWPTRIWGDLQAWDGQIEPPPKVTWLPEKMTFGKESSQL